jgi:putative flippase GtrA
MQFLRFLVTGGIAAVVNLGSRYLLNLTMSFGVSVVLAYLVGMVTAYTLARLFVFADSEGGIGQEFTRFALVNAVALVIVWGVSVGLARGVFPAINFTWHADDLAHAIGVIIPAVTSFVGHKYFTFRPKNRI